MLTQKMMGVALSCQMDTSEHQRTANFETKTTLSEEPNEKFIDDCPKHLY